MTGQRQARNESHQRKTPDSEPRGRAPLLGSLPQLLSSAAPLPDSVSSCVPSDNSFPTVRQEPTLRPQKGSPFLQHVRAGEEDLSSGDIRPWRNLFG